MISPASAKSVWAASRVRLAMRSSLVARHRRRRDRQDRAAEAIAAGMDLPVRHDRRDRVERGHHALPAIVVEAHVAVARVRVLPRHHEHGVAALDEPAHRASSAARDRGCSIS